MRRRGEIAAATGNRNVAAVAGDFGSLEEVRALAAQVLDTCPRLDVLVNNAGIAVRRRRTTKDGLREHVRRQPPGTVPADQPAA